MYNYIIYRLLLFYIIIWYIHSFNIIGNRRKHLTSRWWMHSLGSSGNMAHECSTWLPLSGNTELHCSRGHCTPAWCKSCDRHVTLNGNHMTCVWQSCYKVTVMWQNFYTFITSAYAPLLIHSHIPHQVRVCHCHKCTGSHSGINRQSMHHDSDLHTLATLNC